MDEPSATLFRLYAARLRAVFIRGGLSEADAEDAVQETFACLLGVLADDRIRDLGAWLFGTARHLLADAVRRRVRAREAALGSLEWAEATTDGPESRDACDALVAAVESLPKSLRNALKLRYDRKLSYAQIATQLGISQSAVGTRLHRARNRLRRMLGDLL